MGMMKLSNPNPKLCLLLLFTLSLLLVPSHSYSYSYNYKRSGEEEESPVGELFECFLKCRSPNDHELTHCEQKCVDQYEERKQQEREEQGWSSSSFAQTEEPWKVYQRCQSRCDKHQSSKSLQSQCRTTCQRQYDEMKKHQRQQPRGGDCGCGRPDCHCADIDIVDHHLPRGENHNHDEQERESRNPYFFDSQRFESKFRTEEGHIKVLERFSKKSELLQGIDNYRLTILEANPNTFVLPHHSDAESIFFVVSGKGTVSFVWGNQSQSFNLKERDVIRVPAGAISYLINSDNNQKLRVLKLLQPVNTPGKFKDFFGVGGENPESFYTTFSNDILEAAFNTPADRIEQLFGQQRKGAIIKASKQQIQELSKEHRTSTKGKTDKTWSPINLKKQTPSLSNQFGQYVEASPNDHEQLKDLDVAVGFMNIKKGGMIAPYYNTRSTKLAFVVGGNGYFEMACPHLSEQGRDAQYQKVRARLSVGDVFVVPAGHPVVIVASGESDLQLASFGINGGFNRKQFLAGKKNVWNEVETEAKALSFGERAEEVEEIFGRQDESYFVAGPGRRDEGRRHGVSSILDFAGF